MRQNRIRCCLLLVLSLAARPASAAVALPKVIGDHMLLQRDRAVPIWGNAAPNEAVKVQFAGQTKTATADASGHWRVDLDPLKASSVPAEMVVAASNTITLSGILVGEVWVCSGQSNMEFPMEPVGNFSSKVEARPEQKDALAAADQPELRLFRVEKQLREFTTPGWQECNPQSAAKFSAIAYFYGKSLREKLGVPVGLIETCWGGTRIEPWTSADAYATDPSFASSSTSKPVTIDGARAGTHYEAMVRPLIPYAIRGAIWYQGESNVIATNDRMRYRDKFRAMVNGWRNDWNQGDFPFYTVQIAPYYYTKRNDPLKHSDEEEPLLWEAQLACTALPNVGIVSTIDLVKSFSEIHPSDKWDVGQRLANLALTKTYNVSGLPWAGPTMDSVLFGKGMVIVKWNVTTAGTPPLKTRDGNPPTEFEIAGADGQFIPADAKIDGNQVVLSNPKLADPQSVRFAWHEIAQPNLVDASGLPAYPFRSSGRQN